MKKLILLIALVAFSVTPAFAVNTEITDASTLTIGGSTFTPSSDVTIFVTATVSEYSAASGHLNGSKSYATTSESSTLTSADKKTGEKITSGLVPALPSSTGT